jgi:outer membrane protein
MVMALQVTAQERVSLEQVIALSLEKNYDVQIAKNTASAARTDYNYSIGAYLPQLNATGTYGGSKNDQRLDFENSANNRSGPAQSSNFGGNVALAWTLFDGTRMFATRERLEEIMTQGEFTVKNQMVNTIAAVTVNYYNIVRQKQQLRAIQEQMAVGEERVKLADRKLEVGTGGKPELLQAKVDFNVQRTQVVAQESIIKQLKDQLNGMVDMKLPAEFDVADTIFINLNIQQQEIAQDIELSNYGLQAMRKNLSIANFSLYERRAERLPFLNFNAAYSFNRVNNIVNLNPFGAILNQSRGLNYGFTLTLPILNGFNNRRLVEQAKINVDRQQILLDQQKVIVDVNVKNAFVNYENAKKILLVEEETILLAKENVFIALEGFKRGITTFIELRTAQQSLEEAYNRLIAARYNAKLAETELQRLNGSLLK